MAKILIAGDSTVTDQPRIEPYDPALCYCGWGQMLPRLLRGGAEVCNYAVSGLTTLSFRAEGQYERLRANLAPGDIVLIQFGHNDQKLTELRAQLGYKTELLRYVEELRALGGVPVLVTPVARNSWRGDNGEYSDLLASYAAAMKQAAAESDAALLDLNAASTAWIKGLGVQGAKRYFYPGDYTHANDFGGYRWACMVAKAALESGHASLAALKEMLLPRDEWPAFDVEADNAHPVYGWLAPPAPRIGYEEWQRAGLLTRVEALEMAQKNYGFFVCGNTEARAPYAALVAAKENGYLTKGFVGCISSLAGIVPAGDFRALMLCACRSRNPLPPEAEELELDANEDGTLNRLAAVEYAKQLEQLATGCVPAEKQASAYRPAGA